MVVIYARVPADNSLWEYAAKRGWEDVQVASDADELIRAVRAGKAEIVLASGLNGMARSLPGLVRVLREFVSRKVTLIIPNQHINTSKASSKVFLDTLDAIEEFKREATREGIRPTKVNAYRDDVVRLRAQGLTGRAIAKELNVPSSNVFKLIKGTSLKR